MQRELEANYPDDQLSDDSIIAPGFTDDLSPIHPQRAAREIDRALPKDAILVSDIGIQHNWLIQFCQPSRPDSLIGSMGYGVAGVLGAKLAAPERPCVPVCGDGAFFMHASVLGTAVEYDLPVVWELPSLGQSRQGIGTRFVPD
ncbi:MAG: thiamine pyrophosphate-dependent enzyme [Gammaproteobacteria bacterium]|nr:thiamine pyrophosphate-dependent enzyme [Gammaproteobacteria bacterium]MDX2459555.1 thiamine pyrophosphate-dependent enzyme [Gammaproteobacteria bacterium]